ncbi:MAG: hypothetical protein EOM24_03505 [Chloroflexia bacterium]|nr:hypothetical protein [Chloroflexia bacterium]
MPNLIINELSAVGQAAHPAEVDTLMRDLVETYKLLTTMLCDGRLYGHSLFGIGRLTESMTARDWLTQRHSGSMQDVRRVILIIVNKAPKIDTWLQQHAPGHSCLYRTSAESIDRAFSSLAGAAHMQGWLLSLRNCSDFPFGPVTVEYCEEGEDRRPCQLEHFVSVDDVKATILTYEINPKHKPASSQNSGVRIAPMDLTPDEAQQILNCARRIPGEKRLFAFHQHKIYVFFEHTERCYHGYLLEDPGEYQHRDAIIYNHLLAWGWV